MYEFALQVWLLIRCNYRHSCIRKAILCSSLSFWLKCLAIGIACSPLFRMELFFYAFTSARLQLVFVDGVARSSGHEGLEAHWPAGRVLEASW